jgi:hypothetical protein
MEPLLLVALVIAIFIAMKSVPSVLWPKRYASLVQDEGFVAGHQNIGINERTLDESDITLLFSTLKKWRYETEQPSAPPDAVQAYHGRYVRIVGFMYPLESGRKISTFCLLRSTQTCCYGPRPQYNQYVLVEMDQPVRFERLRPVMVEGDFFVEPRPDEGYIYRMAGTSTTLPKL